MVQLKRVVFEMYFFYYWRYTPSPLNNDDGKKGTPPKSDIDLDTKNDGLENVSPASNTASFWVSLLLFQGG